MYEIRQKKESKINRLTDNVINKECDIDSISKLEVQNGLTQF